MSSTLTRRRFLQHAAAAMPLLLLGGCSRSEPPRLVRRRFADYKALVCVDLVGGNDGYNLLVPQAPDKYELYAAARQDLAIPREQTLALHSSASDGVHYGLHPSCSELHELFNRTRAAILANVGNLSFPATKDDYRAGRVPLRLFSHSDQREQWHSAHGGQLSTAGWAGRIADLMQGVNGDEGLPVNISLAGSNLLQSGFESAALRFSAGGPQRLDNLSADAESTADLRAAFDALRTPEQAHVLESSYAEILERGIRFNELIARQLSQSPGLQTTFPDDNVLAAQLRMVARLLDLRGVLGVKRQIFYVALGGFDTHNDQNAIQPILLRRLSQALRAFHEATVELGIAEAVTTFTTSEFGRTLSTNGQGTDHGWSSHQLIVGGAVHGGSIYGMPPSLVVDGSDDPGGGRFIPQIAVDEYAATLARWFGVGDGDMDYVLPNIGRFASRDLGFMRA